MGLLSFGKKDKDLEEFQSLIEAHTDGMYRMALSYTRDPAAAEDLVHDTVVRALRFRQRFELGTNFRAWIYTVLHHTFVHRYRRKKREREVLGGHSRHDVERLLHSEASRERAESPENSYLDTLLSDDVRAAVDGLADDFRLAVRLCDLEGLSYKEIAEILDVPVGTVMSRLYRGRRLLEKKLRHVAIERGIISAQPDEQGDDSPAESDESIDINRYRRRKRA